MKSTRNARASLLALALFCCAAIVPSQAAASVKPRKLVVPGNEWVMPAIDGSDVYWFSWKKVRHGRSVRWEALLNRTSLIDHSRVRLKRFPDDGFFVESVLAGGGQVVVNFETDRDRGTFRSKVIRLAGDGSGVQELASGTRTGSDEGAVVEGGRSRSGDCGTFAHAHSVTPTGSVVLMQTVSDRDSSKCGGRPDVDHLRVSELPMSGLTREIYSVDLPLEESRSTGSDSGTGSGLATQPGGDPVLYARTQEARITVSGDFAAFVRLGESRVYVRDLNTGAVTGPYGTGLKRGLMYNFPSLDPSGRLAVSTVVLRRAGPVATNEPFRTKFVFRSGVFNTPMNTTPFIRVRDVRALQFCGARLIAGTDRVLVELDPVTFRVKRQLMQYPRHNTSMGLSDYCTEDYFYFTGVRKEKVTVAAYPLK